MRRTVGLLGPLVIAACGDPWDSNPSPVFTTHLVAPELLGQAAPPWRSNDGEIKPHGNIRLNRAEPTEVRAPVDMYWIAGKVQPSEGWLLVFQVTAEVGIRLDHVHELAEPFASQLAGTTGYIDIDPVEVTAGTVIGWSEPATVHPYSTFDFGVTNTTKALTFVNQQRYLDAKMDAKIYADCPYSYFAPEMQALYFDSLGDDHGDRYSDRTACTDRDNKDTPGSVSGAWFPPSGAGAFGGSDHLAIAAAAKGIKLSGLVDFWVPFAENPSPASVSEACYGSDAEYLFLKLSSATQLEAIRGSGPCPATFDAAIGEHFDLFR